MLDVRQWHNTMKLDIFLQTHSVISVHGAHRYVNAPKSEVMLRCAQSLVTSINAAQGDITLTVIDDHSSPECVETLKRILATCNYPVTFVALEGRGYNASALASFSRAREHGREVVYFVEDDYLHAPSAIQEMLDAYRLFKSNLGGREVALFPMDYPDRYTSQPIEETRIVYGPKRHWRTVLHTTNTSWLHVDLVRKNWKLFEDLALYSSTPYGRENDIYEETTINVLWREQAVLFSPIPSLALHLQFEEQRDPYIDWKAWWDAAQYQ